MTTLLVTGGAGFIGSNFLLTALAADPTLRVVNLDRLTYAGNPDNLTEIADDPRYTFVYGDIAEPADVAAAFDAAGDGADVVHFAAESHVDRSLQGAQVFMRTNVLGTQLLLDVARDRGVRRFVHVSTDEVYGSLPGDGRFTEDSPLAPTNPYAASKAASDLAVLAAYRSHGFPAIVTRCSNNFGPRQFPEKLIPLVIAKALADEPVPVYGDGRHVRDWLYVVDHCEALLRVLADGKDGAVYNIGGHHDVENLEIVTTVLAALGKPESLIEHVADRPGHDRRYAMDAARMASELGWKARFDVATALPETVRWYVENETWLERVRSGAYRSYDRGA